MFDSSSDPADELLTCPYKRPSPSATTGGRSLDVAIRIVDEVGIAVPGVVPARVDVADAAGRSAEGCGYYGAREGALQLRLDVAANDRPGLWQIRVCELASGLAATRHVRGVGGGEGRGAK